MKTSSKAWARAAVALATTLLAPGAWGQALPACTPITFESGTTEGFATSGLWHVSTACGANAGAHSTPNVLYYGIDGTCIYDNGAINSGTADSPPIQVPGASEVRFNSRLSVEGDTDFDLANVQYSTDGGGSWQPLLDKSAMFNDGAWHAIVAPLPVLSVSSVQLRFAFNTVDNQFNSALGWMVDDIQVCRQPSVPVPASNPGSLALMAALLALAASGALRFRRR